MRPSPAITLLVVLLVLPEWLVAQQGTQTLTVPTRDPQAISILQSAFAALGGQQALSKISDLTMTGQFTDETGPSPVVKTVRTFVKGLDRVRMETDTTDGVDVVVYSGGQGFHTTKGNKELLRTHSTIGRGLEYFPLLCVGDLLNGPKNSIQPVQVSELNGTAVNHILVQRAFNFDQKSNEVFASMSRVEFFIDQKTSLPIRLRYFTHPDSDSRIDWPVDIDFSDYRPTQGGIVPFTITQVFHGQTVGQFKIQGVSVNNGLADSLFQ